MGEFRFDLNSNKHRAIDDERRRLPRQRDCSRVGLLKTEACNCDDVGEGLLVAVGDGERDENNGRCSRRE